MSGGVIDSLSACWQHLVPYVEGSWARSWPGGICAYTTAAIPTMNGVWSAETNPDVGRLEAALDDVAATGAPYSLQMPVSNEPLVSRLLRRHDLVFDSDSPLMVLMQPGDLIEPPVPSGLEVRTLAGEQYGLHAQVAAAGFEAPPEIFDVLRGPALASPALRTYIGELDGVAVVTGLGLVVDGRLGVFNIATPAPYRGRGYGAALTARIVVDGINRGADSAWLESSDAGFGIYRRLGFRVVDTWRCWISRP